MAHSDAWYQQRNAAVGRPRGARHSDAWYEQELARLGLWGRGTTQNVGGAGNAPAGGGGQNVPGQNAPPTPGGLPVDPNPQSRPPGWSPWFDPGPVQIPPTPPVVTTPVVTPPTPEQAAEAGARQRAALDAWDHLNSQRDYDADGWQSMGFQPDYIPMPAGWAENNWLPPTPPVAPGSGWAAPAPGGPGNSPAMEAAGQAKWNARTVAPDIDPARRAQMIADRTASITSAPTGLTTWGQTLPPGPPLPPRLFTGTPTGLTGWGSPPAGAGAATQPANALAPLVGTAPAVPQMATSQSANAWGSGQNPYAGMQPDPGAWGQSPPRQRNAGFGAPNQGRQSWGQPRQRRSGNLWGPNSAQAGTWGSGTI